MNILKTAAAFGSRFSKRAQANSAMDQLAEDLVHSWTMFSSADLSRALPDGWTMRRSPDYDVTGGGRLDLNPSHLSVAIMKIEIHGVHAVSYSARDGVKVLVPFTKNTDFICGIITDALDEAIGAAAIRGLARIALEADLGRRAKLRDQESQNDPSPA